MAVTTPMTTQTLAASVDKGIRKHFVDDYKPKEPKIEKVMQVGTQEDYNEEHQGYTGAGDLPVVAEGAAYTANALLQTYKTTYTPIKYGEYISVTDEEMRYEKAALTRASNIGKAQSRQTRRKIERVAADVYNNAFDTSFTSYGDGKPLASIDHTRADGGTSFRNVSASGITLTHTNLETAILDFREQTDDRGQLIEAAPMLLLVAPKNEAKARKITNSMLQSGTADNDSNVFKMKEYHGGSLKVCVWDYLSTSQGGSDDAWYLLDPETHKITWLWGVKPEVAKLDDTTGNLSDQINWKVRMEASTGWSDVRGFWASKGDGLSYTS